MRRLASAIAFVVLAYALPLVGRADLYTDARVLFAALSAAAVMLLQPTLSWRDVGSARATDKGTAVLIIGCAIATQVAAVVELRMMDTPPAAATAAIGGAMIVLGGLLRVVAVSALGASFTATVQVRRGQEIARTGIYRWLRHPSYLGGLLAIVGVPVLFGDRWATAFALVTMLAVYARRIKVEEAALIGSVGLRYEAYRRRTWAWIPFVW